MDLSIEFAKAGLGIACIISEFVKNDLKEGTLHRLKPGHRVPKRQIRFAFPEGLSSSESMNTFMEYYKRHMS